MIELLNYPFDNNMILRKRRKIRKELLKEPIKKELKVAVLGGSTTSEIINIIELFLLKNGFSVSFYESEYNKYYEDAVFENEELLAFKPDVIYIHTTHHNIIKFPDLGASEEDVETMLENEVSKFKSIWDSLKKYNCPIIQNNFDLPINRSLGNLDCYDIHGKTYFLNRLNLSFGKEARENKSLYINDINYLSTLVGLNNWHDKNLWFTAKYAVGFDAIPTLANNIVSIVMSILGMSKKCLVLDLDNTCWGGVIGDDGLNGIKLGNETAAGEAYMKFQNYAKELKGRGVILAVSSKNDHDIAKEAFTHSDSVLSFEDFTSFKANWEPKYLNIEKIAKEINIGLDSLVFIDDNAMERNIVESQLPVVSVPNVGNDVLNYIDFIERNGYFETVNLSADDINRNRFYSDNKQRAKLESTFENYQDFLGSLDMKSEIKPFSSVYIERITQLINKTNQFNLTTKRYKLTEVNEIAASEKFIPLYGKLTDKFGDNGLISVVIGEIVEDVCVVDTWLMSCRVLKRDMEFAMLDELVKECKNRGIEKIRGTYKSTPKNKMVSNLYPDFGFEFIEERIDGAMIWDLEIDNYIKKDIKIN
ncbi:HAD family hydrolase [uncultured Tenacibaculum sp.]|uniref:HAD-IIIC family phosphatase n=1 Tax=uncultured Tenacibaculum sp. TaxID=174713 RepID=UPI00262BC57C|nr:HAD-IIIC family phosphatase [uncultured Tenacibaculum sp.]